MLTTATSSVQAPLLRHVSNIVSSDQTIDSILQEIITLTRKVTNSDACLLYQHDPLTGEMILRASQVTPHFATAGEWTRTTGLIRWLGANRCLVAIPQNASSDLRFRSVGLTHVPYEAFLSIPLVARGTFMGVVNVHHKDPHQHSREEVALVTFIGEQVGSLIARERLTQYSRAAGHRMRRLTAVAQAISAGSLLERILQAISEMLAETFDSAVCSILLVDSEKSQLTASAARCSAPDYLHHTPIRLQNSPVEAVVRQGLPIIILDIHNARQYRYPELTRKSGLTSLLCAPLSSEGKVIGAINVYTRDERIFTEDEIGFTKIVAGQAAISIRNARLLSEAMDLKHTLEARELIECAKAILQQKYNLTEEQAYFRLRNESSKLRRPMKDLAEAVILADVVNTGNGGRKKTISREDEERQY